MASELGVTGPQRLVIRIVGRFPGVAAGRLAEILHVHPSTLTGVLKRLESRGLVKRRPDPADGRRALLGLTPRGKEIDGSRTGTVEAQVRRALDKLPARKIAIAQELLEALAEALEDEG
jgi:DNA-binding MarR family transcriptional regulator